MSKIIIYQQKDGGVAVIRPINRRLPIEQLAQKDVPEDTPFRIIDSTKLPSGRGSRNTWTFENIVKKLEGKL